MARDLIFNMDCLRPDDDYNPYKARQWATTLGQLFKEAQTEQHFENIRFEDAIQSRNIMRDYPFQKWLNTDMQQPLRLLLKSWMVNKQRVRIPTWIDLRQLEIQTDARYLFDNKSWGLAFVRDHILVSLASEPRWDCELLNCEYIDRQIDDETIQTSAIRHSSTVKHLRQHKRLYYCHPKHCHDLPFSGVRGTSMDLNEKEAQQVLNRAVQAPAKKQLYGYSKRTQKLYEFQPESPPSERPWLGQQNQFHGYPIDPAEVQQDIGGNDYDDVIQGLKDSGQIDDIAARRFAIH